MTFRVVLLACMFWAVLTATVPAQDGPASGISPLAEAARLDVGEEALRWHVLGLSAAELSQVADTWHSYLAKNLEAISEVATGAERAESHDAETAPDLADLIVENDEILDRYAIILSAWERKGGPEEDVDQHRTYIRGSVAQMFRSADLAATLEVVFHWLTSWRGGISLLLQVALFGAAIVLIFGLARLVRGAVVRKLQATPNISVLQKSLLGGGAFWLTVAIGTFVILFRFGGNLTLVAAIIGGLGVILAVSMQNAIGNIACSFLLALFRPFDIGDTVRIGDIVGRVEAFGMDATRIRRFDNLVVRVPNEDVWRGRLSNFSASDRLRVELVFNVGFPQDQDKAVATLRAVIANEPSCYKDPAPQVFVAEVGEASIGIYCRAWVDSAEYWTTSWALTSAGVAALDKAGIQIANPLFDVRVQPPRESN